MPLTKQWYSDEERLVSQLDMVALSVFRAGLTAFNAAELFDAAMVCLDHPADFRVLQPGRDETLRGVGLIPPQYGWIIQ